MRYGATFFFFYVFPLILSVIVVQQTFVDAVFHRKTRKISSYYTVSKKFDRNNRPKGVTSFYSLYSRGRNRFKSSSLISFRGANRVIPRLRDQANIEQSSSKHPANAFKIHVHDVRSNCSMFARCLLHDCLIV